MTNGLATITAIAALSVSTAVAAAPIARDWTPVAQALGKAGSVQPDGGYRVPLPRTDLHVMLDGVPLKAGFALGSWVAFAPMGKETMVMGDLVLTQDEVSPVMKSLEENGLEITALHNHLLRAEPVTLYMHVMGRGDPVKLAQTLHAALALSKTPFAAPPPAGPAADLGIDVAAIDRTLGAKGKVNGGVLQYGIPRQAPVRDGGMVVPTSLGSAIAINFQPTGEGRAAITGDFVLAGSEVNPVIRALRAHGIEVTALHNHMLDDQPRMFFMHFWANDNALTLAQGLRAALEKVAIAKSGG
jgi:biotin operon repressor